MERKSYTKVLKGTWKFGDYSECLQKAVLKKDLMVLTGEI
jgi:rRNA-processing protein FCF1